MEEFDHFFDEIIIRPHGRLCVCHIACALHQFNQFVPILD